MNELNLIIPPVPSVNHLYSTNRQGRRFMTQAYKDYKKGIGSIGALEKYRQNWIYSMDERIVMELRIFWPDARRRDADNIIKIIQDSFTGILYHDDYLVFPRVMDVNIDRKNPRVEIKFFKL
jgi:crossover junction endodeoxyribonuclease RusA